MSRNGSGTYTLPKPPFVPNTTISSADVNSDLSDIAAALTASIAADGQTLITAALKFPSGTVSLPSHTFSADLTSGMYYIGSGSLGFASGGVGTIRLDGSRSGAGQDGAILTYANGAIIRPVGEIAQYGGGSPPQGWFLCFGQAISRTAYSELFLAIGTNYGSGDGTTTFNLPDLRGRAAWGKDNMGGAAAGRITVGGCGVDGSVLGAGGGSQNTVIVTLNLPPYTPTGSVTTPTITTNIVNGTSIVTNISGSLYGGGPVGNVTTITANSSATTPVFTGNAQGGGSTGMPTVSPFLIISQMIWAGRP